MSHLSACDRPLFTCTRRRRRSSLQALMRHDAPLGSFLKSSALARYRQQRDSRRVSFTHPLLLLGPEAHYRRPPGDRGSSRLANTLWHRAGECRTAGRLGVKHIFSFSDALCRPPFCPAASVSFSLQVPKMFSITLPSRICHSRSLFHHLSDGVLLNGLDLISASNEPSLQLMRTHTHTHARVLKSAA